jgi:hypothetical protein
MQVLLATGCSSQRCNFLPTYALLLSCRLGEGAPRPSQRATPQQPPESPPPPAIVHVSKKSRAARQGGGPHQVLFLGPSSAEKPAARLSQRPVCRAVYILWDPPTSAPAGCRRCAVLLLLLCPSAPQMLLASPTQRPKMICKPHWPLQRPRPPPACSGHWGEGRFPSGGVSQPKRGCDPSWVHPPPMEASRWRLLLPAAALKPQGGEEETQAHGSLALWRLLRLAPCVCRRRGHDDGPALAGP